MSSIDVTTLHGLAFREARRFGFPRLAVPIHAHGAGVFRGEECYAPGRRQCSVFADMTSRISPASGLAPVFVEIRNLEDRQAQVWDEVNQVVLGRRTRHFESRVHGQGRRTGPDLGNLTGGNPWPAQAFASDDLTRYAR